MVEGSAAVVSVVGAVDFTAAAEVFVEVAAAFAADYRAP